MQVSFWYALRGMLNKLLLIGNQWKPWGLQGLFFATKMGEKISIFRFVWQEIGQLDYFILASCRTVGLLLQAVCSIVKCRLKKTNKQTSVVSHCVFTVRTFWAGRTVQPPLAKTQNPLETRGTCVFPNQIQARKALENKCDLKICEPIAKVNHRQKIYLQARIHFDDPTL